MKTKKLEKNEEKQIKGGRYGGRYIAPGMTSVLNGCDNIHSGNAALALKASNNTSVSQSALSISI